MTVLRSLYLKGFILLTTICSCRRSDKVGMSLPITKPKDNSILWEQRFVEAQKDHEIYGAFDVSADTTILLRRQLGIELSPDRGKTWIWLAKKIFRIDEFTIDDKGTWWGLERWKGIHEPSYCRIHFSEDAGKTWETVEFNTGILFPYHICSKPCHPLEISDFWTKKMYRPLSNKPLGHWQFLKQLPNHDNDIVDLSVENYFVSSENYLNKLYVKRKNGSIDTLVSFPKAYNIYDIQKYENVIYVAGPSATGDNSYFAEIKNERLSREFTVSGVDLSLTRTRFDHLYLTSSDGAFQYKKGILIHIFK